MIRVAEQMSPDDRCERAHKALAARYDRLNELLRHNDAYSARPQGRASHRRARFCRAPTIIASAHLQRRPAEPRSCWPSCCWPAPDIMLLDEPSNHLDIDATRWLEELSRPAAAKR